jgi:hypothetical protein
MTKRPTNAVGLEEGRRALRAALHRVDQLHELRASESRRGRCGDCQTDAIPVFVFDDQHWQICAPCIDRRILHGHLAIQVAIAQCRAAGGKRCQHCGDFHKYGVSCECRDPRGVS